MPETPKAPEEEPKILNFKEFTQREFLPHYGNFFIYFNSGFAGEVYRESAHYKRFASEYPEMAESLCDKIQKQRDKRIGTSESLKPFDRDLYEAYKIMRGYGLSDSELFT
jgi:hypothetical protein